MGSPLACILANIFMECVESEFLSLFPLQPALWLRYVDDIFLVWPHGKESFQIFLDGLNQLFPSIRFSTEWESLDENTGISTLPFLDIQIHRTTQGVTFSVYRKPTHSQLYIHYFSNHAPHVKRGLLSSLFLRALRLSSSEHLQSEFDILWAAFRRIGYPHFFIREALSAAKTRFYASPPELSNSPIANPPITRQSKTISFPYHPTFSKLTPFMKASNFKLVFSSSDSIGKAVVNKKGRVKTSTQDRSGVYHIPCLPGCDKSYYGRTQKPLHQRIHEHRQDINANIDDGKGMITHTKSHPGHHFNLSAARLVWHTDNKYESQFIETTCINTLANCNRRSGDIAVNPAISSLVSRIVVSQTSQRSGNNSRHLRNSLYVSPLASDVSAPNSTPLTPSLTSSPLTSSPTSPDPSPSTSLSPLLMSARLAAGHTSASLNTPIVPTISHSPLQLGNSIVVGSTSTRSNISLSQLASYSVHPPGTPLRSLPATQPANRHLASDQLNYGLSPLTTRSGKIRR